MLCRLALAALLTATGCTSDHRADRAEPSPTPPRPAFDASTAKTGGDRAPATRPIPVREARRTPDQLFELRQARRGETVFRGSRIGINRDADVGPDRLVLYRAKPGSRRYDVLLLDLTTRKVLATFDQLFDASTRAGAIWGGRGAGAEQSIVRLADGGIVRARPRLPDHARAKEVKVAVHGPGLSAGGSPDVWLFARTADGVVYHGRWADLSDPSPLLTEQLNFWPTSSWSVDRLEVWKAEGIPVGAESGGDCVRFALGSDRPPTCRATANDPNASGGTYAADGWAYYGGEVRNAYAHTSVQPQPDCYGLLNAALVAPPRFLAACSDKKWNRNYLLWTPDGSFTFREPETNNLFHMINAGKPVIPLLHLWLDSDVTPNPRWIDLERATMTRTEPLFPVDFALAGLDRQFLAVRPGTGAKQLVLVDLDAATTTTIARIDDCDGTLYSGLRRGRRLAMICQKRTSKTKFVFAMRWAEVIDLDARRRWRTSLMPRRILPDGRILASDNRRIAGETIGTGSGIYWLELD